MYKINNPKRIICLTEEGTELIYAIGEQDRLVGISGFTYRPPEARKEKPKVCTFLDAKYDLIDELKPDIIIGYSDLQADIAQELIKRGHSVHIFNHHTLQGIFDFMHQFFGLIGELNKGEKLIENYQNQLNQIISESKLFTKKPKVFFEEWYDPIMAGSTWTQELIEILGAEVIFPKIKNEKLAKNRILLENQLIDANPDIIIGSWCGKMFKPEQVKNRKGFDKINAVKNNQLYEIKSELILQPGPAALTDGANAIFNIIKNYQSIG